MRELVVSRDIVKGDRYRYVKKEKKIDKFLTFMICENDYCDQDTAF